LPAEPIRQRQGEQRRIRRGGSRAQRCCWRLLEGASTSGGGNAAATGSSTGRPWRRPRPCAGTERGRRERLRWSGWGAPGAAWAFIMEWQGRGRKARTRGMEVGRVSSHGEGALLHGRHTGNSSNTWSTAEWPRWGAIWAAIWAELVLGPKTKFVAHMKLYVFH
jgi:hypothetical protein